MVPATHSLFLREYQDHGLPLHPTYSEANQGTLLQDVNTYNFPRHIICHICNILFYYYTKSEDCQLHVFSALTIFDKNGLQNSGKASRLPLFLGRYVSRRVTEKGQRKAREILFQEIAASLRSSQ